VVTARCATLHTGPGRTAQPVCRASYTRAWADSESWPEFRLLTHLWALLGSTTRPALGLRRAAPRCHLGLALRRYQMQHTRVSVFALSPFPPELQPMGWPGPMHRPGAPVRAPCGSPAGWVQPLALPCLPVPYLRFGPGGLPSAWRYSRGFCARGRYAAGVPYS